MASVATVADVLESMNSPRISTFVEHIFGVDIGDLPITEVDFDITPAGMSFLQQSLWSLFKKECQKWKKNGNRQPPGARTAAEKYIAIGAPSGFGKPSGWSKWQHENPNLPIMCHRPEGLSWVNLSIIHPVFWQIMKVVDFGEPATDDYLMAAELCAVMPDAFEVENSRRDRITQIFNEYMPGNASESIGVKCIANKFDTDGTAAHAGTNIEFKNEKGKGDSDPYMQNIAYYIQYWGDENARKKQKRKRGSNLTSPGPAQHCCPWMLIEVIGQEIGVSGAAYVDGTPCAQPLSPNIPFLSLPSDRRSRMQQARFCQAIRQGFNTLKAFYADEPSVDDPQAGFPFIRKFTPRNAMDEAAEVNFSYTAPLVKGGGKMLFFATIDETGERVFVKFCEKYNVEAHELAATNGLAPALRSAMELDCGLVMIVMDPVDGAHHWGPNESATAKQNLQRFQQTFLNANLVHGDLRSPNVLVDANDNVFVVDFDWAGSHETEIYPIAVNPEEEWHEDVQVGKVMKLEHDKFMVQNLLSM